jgi:hypothetical protein
VKYGAWDDAKTRTFRVDRGIGFEDIVFHIERSDLLDSLEQPNVEDAHDSIRNRARNGVSRSA